MRTAILAHEPATEPRATLVYVDPATLIIGANVRRAAQVTQNMVSSVRQRGVRHAIVAYRDGNGALVVVLGQRRAVAAVKAKRPVVPVLVEPQPDECDRLFDQINENDHREGLTVADRAAAYEQLAAFGLSAAQIAKRASAGRPSVDAGLRIARSKLARAATNRWDFLTLDQAAAIAEFEDDGEAVKQLVVASKQGGFDHRAQQLRDARTEAAARAEAAAALVAVGVTVVEQPASGDRRVKGLSYLKHDDQDLTEDAHATCPGHAAYLDHAWVHPEPADEPWQDDTASPDRPPAPERPKPYRAWVARHVCTDFAAHGHALRFPQHGAGSEPTAVDEMTDAEREEALVRRRDVVQSNKDWESAETVRRRWLRTFLSRNSAPDSAASFIAGSLARADHAVTRALTAGNYLAHELFGILDQAPALGRRAPGMVDVVGKANDARALMITLGLVLAAYEEATSRNSWRAVSDATTRYLRYLEANDYELSAVELRACGETPPAAQADAGDETPLPAAA